MKVFFKTVAIVTVFSVCEKCLGFLYRIFLSRTIGTEGIGIYQVALSVFSLILTACCSGTPITVSRLMTKYKAKNDVQKVKEVISSGLFSTLFTVIPVFLIFLLLSGKLGFLFADERCVPVFLVVLPGIIFTSLYSVLRGVFWGNKDFLPYSIIELLEELCMIIVGILLISRAKTVTQGAIYAGIAVLISFILSFSLALIVFFIRKNKLINPFPQLKPLISSAVPITTMRTANSLVMSLVSIILPSRLMAFGYSNGMAMSVFGATMGQTLPLLYIPTTIIGSFILVLVPEISENYYKKEYRPLKRNVEKAIKYTLLISCVFIPLFTVCGEEIGIIVFNSHECGKYLSHTSFLMFFMGLSVVTTSILNSVGLEKKTLLYYGISGVLMVISIWFLPQVMGIYALFIGLFFLFGLSGLLNFILLFKTCKYKPKCIAFTFCIIATLIPTIVFGLMIEKLLSPVFGIVSTFFICSIILSAFYLLLIVSLGVVDISAFKLKLRHSVFSLKKRPSEKRT